MGRYLLAASSIPGHLLPMMRIGADLIRRGHTVRLLTAQAFAGLAAARGIPTVILPRAAEVVAPPGSHGGPGPLRRWRIGRAELLSVFLAPLVAQSAALRAELDHDTPDAILVDLAFTGAIPLLLSARPRPATLVCGVGPLLLSSADTAPFGTGWRPRPGVTYRSMTRFTHDLLFRDVQARFDAMLRSAGSRCAPVFLTDWPALADRILQLTVPDFEYPRRDLPPSVLFTGPLPAEDTGDNDFPVTAGRRRIHVTQGTWDNGDPTQLIVPTLRALAGRADLEVIAATGHTAALPITPPDNARIVEFCSYPALLPSVDVMVTNGGYGGVHAALSHGIPLVVAGDTADKPEVAARVAHVGAGLNLQTARPTPRAIATAVDRILSTDSYRRAARQLSGAIAASRPFDVIEQSLATYHRSEPVRATTAIPRRASQIPTEEHS